jgi:hypothetical protein
MARHESSDSGRASIDQRSGSASLIVRFWRPAEGGQQGCRGWVEEVESGEKTPFLGVDQLQRVISDLLAEREEPERE